MTTNRSMPNAATRLTHPQPGDAAPAWWDDQVEPVRAVLDLAWLRGDAGNEPFDRIVDLFAPMIGSSITNVAELLVKIDRLESGHHDLGFDPEWVIDRAKREAVTDAELIASLILAGVR